MDSLFFLSQISYSVCVYVRGEGPLLNGKDIIVDGVTVKMLIFSSMCELQNHVRGEECE
jgi:hypothetical protein